LAQFRDRGSGGFGYLMSEMRAAAAIEIALHNKHMWWPAHRVCGRNLTTLA
jgi:hypothetical protein